MATISSCFVPLICLLFTLHTVSCVGKSHQMTDIEWNPCSKLENPTPKQLEDATKYCILVIERFLRHPASPWSPWNPNIRNPQCSRKDPPPAEGRPFRCTVKFLVRFELRNPLTPVNIADFITDPTFWSYRKWDNIGKDKLELLKNPSSDLEKLIKRVEKVKIENTWNDIGVYAAKGKRSKMEDTFMAYENAWGTGASFFGVFDGHTGAYAASYARDRLMKNIVNRVADLKYLMGSPIEPGPSPSKQALYIGSVKKGCHEADPNRWRWEEPKSESKKKRQLKRLKTYLEVGGIINYQMFLRDVFKSTDLDLCASARRRESETGTTALVAIIDGSQLIVANVGDSRGVMCDSNGDPVPLSFDQKPNRKDEAERLEKAGGRISCDDGGITRLDDCIGISRSLGDQAEKLKHHLIPDPEVFIFDLSKYKPKFIVLATDGLYHHLTNDQVVAFIHQRLDEDDLGAKSLVRYAYLLGARDNITVMVIYFENDKWPPNPRNGWKTIVPSFVRRKYTEMFGYSVENLP